MRTFKEYLNSKGKTEEKPDVETVPDYDGPDPNAPQKPASKGKNWDASGQSVKEAPKPYRAPGTDPGLAKAEKGLGDKGDKGLKYNPNTKTDAAGTKKKTWPKTTTEHMSVSELSSFLVENADDNFAIPHVYAPCAGPITPDPTQATKYVVFLANNNENVLGNIIQEMKNHEGGIGRFIKKLLDHADTHNELTKQLADEEHGSIHARRLARAMDSAYYSLVGEGVVPPRHKDMPKNNMMGDLAPSKMEPATDEPPTAQQQVTAHGNVINAMQTYPYMQELMKGQQ